MTAREKWRRLGESDLAGTVSQKEIDVYRRSEPVDGSDPVAALLERTGRMIRGYMRSVPQIRTDPHDEASIPEGLVNAACDYAAFDVLKRQPLPISEDRRAARRDAIALFAKIAERKFIPSSWAGEDAGATPAAARQAIKSRRRVRADGLNGY
jgi:hypothetical protein